MSDRKSKTPEERALEALGPKLRAYTKAAKNANALQGQVAAAVAAMNEAADRLAYAVANPDLPERDDNDMVDQAKCELEDHYGVTEVFEEPGPLTVENVTTGTTSAAEGVNVPE